MKMPLFLLWAVAGSSLAIAQTTNPPAPSNELFRSPASDLQQIDNDQDPPLRLHLEEPAPAEPNGLATRSSGTNAPLLSPLQESAANAAFAGGGFTSATEQHLFRMLDEGGYLTPTSPRDSAIQRTIDAIWEPEVFSLGKVKVSCSVATAVKRKNPLCLLTPLFFNLNW
jgi:hypothetical protein